jgi:hypothetical protein
MYICGQLFHIIAILIIQLLALGLCVELNKWNVE